MALTRVPYITAQMVEVVTHLLRAVAVMPQRLWPTHCRCCWLCPLSGRLMDQRPTGTASWLPIHNQILRTACHRWKSKWVILHKLAILYPCGNNKKKLNLNVIFVTKTTDGGLECVLRVLHFSLVFFISHLLKIEFI